MSFSKSNKLLLILIKKAPTGTRNSYSFSKKVLKCSTYDVPDYNIDLNVFFVFARLSIGLFAIGAGIVFGTDLNYKDDHAIVDDYEQYWPNGSAWDFFDEVGFEEYFQDVTLLR